jgi:transposase InsO family protein
VPFASSNALFNLSKLAVWWLRLGIGIERIKPGHPQQNGRHERMHLTLKKKPPNPRPQISCNSKRASTNLSMSSITNAHMKLWK